MPKHEDLTDPNLHEPKGAASANEGEVYVADGAGTGAWTASGKYLEDKRFYIMHVFLDPTTASTRVERIYFPVDVEIIRISFIPFGTYDAVTTFFFSKNTTALTGTGQLSIPSGTNEIRREYHSDGLGTTTWQFDASADDYLAFTTNGATTTGGPVVVIIEGIYL